jgi:signal transduction histidine kinase
MLDIRTTLLLLWMGNLIVVALLLVYRYSQRPKFPFSTFIITRFVQMVAWLLLWLRGSIPDIVSILWANGILFTGWMLEAFILFSIRQKRGDFKKFCAFAFVGGFFISAFIYQYESTNIRNALASLVPLAIFIPPDLFLISDRRGSFLQRVTGFLYLLFSAANIFRAVDSFTSAAAYTLMSQNTSQTITFVSIFWLMFFGAISYLLISREIIEKELTSAATQVAIMEERARLSHNLHDSVMQSIYGFTLYVKSMSLMIKNGELQELDALLQTVVDIARQVLMEMRLMVYELRPSIVVEFGFVEALRQRLDIVEAHGQIKTRVLTNSIARLDSCVEDILYNIAIEALNNILKYAAASEVKVLINIEPERVVMTVQDNGVGYHTETATLGAGIRGMRERAAQVRGNMDIHSEVDGGTTVTVTIPISNTRRT